MEVYTSTTQIGRYIKNQNNRNQRLLSSSVDHTSMSGANINKAPFNVLSLRENSKNSISNWRVDAVKIRSIKDDLNFTQEKFFPRYGPNSTR